MIIQKEVVYYDSICPKTKAKCLVLICAKCSDMHMKQELNNDVFGKHLITTFACGYKERVAAKDAFELSLSKCSAFFDYSMN